MRGLDFIATAAAVGVFGYFMYKVILPKLSDLQLPFWQPPSTTTTQQPVAAPAVDQVPPAQPIEQDPEKPKQEQDQPKSQAPLVPSRSPPAAVASSAGGTLLYDSNTHGKWNSGQARTGLKKEGSTNPNGKGIQTAASGNPTFSIDGKGVLTLTSSDLGRIYIYANNYNTRLEGSMMFLTNNGPKDNISIKIRSRHGHSGHTTAGGSGCPCGGIGAALHMDGSIDMQAESCHDSGSTDMPPQGKAAPPATNKWYKFAFSVWDEGASISSKFELDGKVVGTGKWPSPTASCKTKALFDADSYFWLRLNSYYGTAKAAFTNLRLYDLGSGGGTAAVRKLMIDEPYLFNGYYGRRRL